MKQLKLFDKYVEEFFLLILMSTMVALTFSQVIMRYIFGNPLVWSEEFVRYSFIWLVYIGVSYAVKKESHIKVDILPEFFKEKGKIIIQTISNVIFFAFALLIIIFGFDLTSQLLQYTQTSPSLQIPMAYIYMAAPVGMSLTAIRLIQNTVKILKNYRVT